MVPETTFYCDSGSPKGGYYKGRKIRCDCRVRGDNHKGFAQWIKDGVAADEPIETITLMSNATGEFLKVRLDLTVTLMSNATGEYLKVRLDLTVPLMSNAIGEFLK